MYETIAMDGLHYDDSDIPVKVGEQAVLSSVHIWYFTNAYDSIAKQSNAESDIALIIAL